MTTAKYCLRLVQQAVAAARKAQVEMAGSVLHDFDRMAINDALGFLESTLAELSCFARFRNEYPRAELPHGPT
jgi:hypothetical protein